MQLSPDGKRIAYVGPDGKDVMQVWVQPLEGDAKAKVVTADRKRGIRQYQWTEDGKGILYLQDTDGDENFHVHGVDLTSGNVRDYTPLQGVRADIVATSPTEPDSVLVQMNARSRAAMDVYRVTLSTGALVLDTENTAGDVGSWVVDRRLRVRGAEVSLPDGGTELRVRDDNKSAWRVLVKAGPDDLLGLYGFSPDGRSAYVQSSLGSDKARLLDWPLDGSPQRIN